MRVRIVGKRIPLILQEELPPAKKIPISFIADKAGGSFLVEPLFPHAKEHSLHRWTRGWPSGSLPVAVFWRDRGSSRRERLLKLCREAKHPLIVLCFDGGAPGKGLCPDGLTFHLGLGDHAILFAWTNNPSAQQLAVLDYLQRNWSTVPFRALKHLASLESISYFVE